MTPHPCALCGSQSKRVLYPARVRALPESYRITEEKLQTCWDIVRCADCGLIASDWTCAPEVIDHLYEGMEDELYDAEQHTRRLTFHRGLNLIGKYMKSGTLLDIGCATGGFLLEAKEMGWQTMGIDLSSWAVERAKSRGLSDMHLGTIHDFTPSRPVDVATMLDFIEHDTDPVSTIEKLKNIVRPGGLLYITTPDIGSLTAKLLRSRWWGINPLHLSFFSRTTMRRLLEEHGFTVIRANSYTRVFTLGYWASRLSHFSPALSKVVGGTFRLLHLDWLPVPMNLGDMMQVVAKRNG